MIQALAVLMSLAAFLALLPLLLAALVINALLGGGATGLDN